LRRSWRDKFELILWDFREHQSNFQKGAESKSKRRRTNWAGFMSKSDESKELMKRVAELKKRINFYALTCRPLHSDFNYAIKQWQHDRTSQFWSRTAIRCLCAAIEATLFSFRTMAEQAAGVSNIQFDPKELEILSEKQIRNGVQRTKFLSPPDAVKESFRLFAKAIGTTVTVDYGNGFSDLCATFKVRDRLMHPKKPFDVEVNVENIETADRGIAWFNKAYTDVFNQCQAQIAQNIESILKRS
jgi:hypothetical protein